MATKKAKIAADKLALALDADVLLFNSPIERGIDDVVLRKLKQRSDKAKNAILIAVTEGGNPDAAYRIAKFFQHYYEKFTFLTNGYCKSAGALMAVGAHELVVSVNGELGPIDVQVSKRDELIETQSTQVIGSGLTGLAERAFNAFEYFLLETQKKSMGRITFKTAADIAAKLTAGLFSPIYQQVDPLLVGENIRIAALANQYAARLDAIAQNLKPNSLEYLVAGYGTHGFVIDIDECRELFENVREPSQDEEDLCEELGNLTTTPVGADAGVIGFVSDMMIEEEGGNASEIAEDRDQLEQHNR